MTVDKEKRKRDEQQLELTVLAVLGWILPLAGLAWGGAGEWWHYLIWLAIGTAVILVYAHTTGLTADEDEPSAQEDEGGNGSGSASAGTG